MFNLRRTMTTNRRWLLSVALAMMVRQTVELQVNSVTMEIARPEIILAETSQRSVPALSLKVLKPHLFHHALVDDRRHRSLDIGM
jgi:hypothetical protein